MEPCVQSKGQPIAYDVAGLIPAVVQDWRDGTVLMLGYMNEQAVANTLATKFVHFWSRSRQKFWMKGEESGNTQTVKDVAFDCDGDCLLIQVEQNGPACHEGYQSCFFRSIEGKGETFKVTEAQLLKPEQMYQKK